MSFDVAPPATPVVPVFGETAAFPVNPIYRVGRKYLDHAIKIDYTGCEAPSIFLKPADAVVPVAPGSGGRKHCPGLALA